MAASSNYTVELAKDIADVEDLLTKAERPNVRRILEEYLHSLRAEMCTLAGGAPPPPPARAAEELPDVSNAAPAAPPPKPRAPAPPPPKPVKLPTAAPGASASVDYTAISSFGWDQDTYGKEPNFVYIYIMSGVDGVGEIKERVTCDFTTSSFDLKIIDLNGKNLRLVKTNLEKEIIVEQSKMIVKKNRITLKLMKKKGQYGYDNWLDLVAKRSKLDEEGKEKDPGASLMDMMKDMYDNGDDHMRKTLGEAMLKSRQKQEAGGPNAAFDDDMKMDDD